MNPRLHTCALLLASTLACQQEAPSGHGRDRAPVPPRIISLHDTTTEILVGIGAAPDLIAVAGVQDLSPRATQETAGTPRLPHGPLSGEALIALRPTHVFGTNASLTEQPDLLRQLELAGSETLFIDPRGLQGLWDSIEETGRSIGYEAAARAWSGELMQQIEQIREEFGAVTQGAGREPVRVFFYDCCDPPFTAGGSAPIGEILQLLGARNVFADLDQDWARVSWEAVLERDPELVVVHDYAFSGQGSADDKIERLRTAAFATNVTAVRNDQFVVLPLSLALEGPRILEAVDVLSVSIADARRKRRTAVGTSAR